MPPETFNLRLDSERKATLMERAQRHGMTLSDVMRAGAEHVLDRLDDHAEQFYTVIGAAGLPLGERDEAWDAQAAKNSLTEAQYADAFFYRDPDQDASNISAYKLGFARNDNGLHAVFRGVTAVAAVLQGGRGGVDIPQDEQDRVKGKVNGYYAKAREKYNDDSIQPPWQDGGSACVENQEALAMIEAWSDDEWSDYVGRFAPTPPPTVADVKDQPHVFQASGEDAQACAVCDNGPGADVHDAAMAETPHTAVPMPPSMEKCAVCAQDMSAAIHDDGGGSEDEDDLGTRRLDGLSDAYVELADGRRIVAFAPVVVEGEGETGDSPADAEMVSAGVPFRATLAQEGVPTDDGRQIEKGALEWRSLPLTLMAIIEDSHGGMPQTRTVVSGRIDNIERVDTGDATADIIGTGVFDTGDQGAEIARLVSEKMLRGVSVDLAVKESEEIIGSDVEGGIEDPFFGGSYLLIVKSGVILGATVCPFPAFGDADIETVTASAGVLPRYAIPAWRVNKDDQVIRLTILGEFAPADDAPPAPPTDPDNDQDNDTDPISGSSASLRIMVDELPTADELAGVDPTKLAVTYDGNDLNLADATLVDPQENTVDLPLGKPLTASAAGLVPVHPPVAWFDYPSEALETPDTLLPLTITKEGRVWGHVAAFNECHVGIPGKCQIAPHHFRGSDRLCATCGEPEAHRDHSIAAYDYFHLGELETAEGELVRVGQLTISTNHAASSFSAKQAQDHYANSGTAVADLHLYEDGVGVMSAGALRPDVAAVKIRETRGSKPSGDWRIVRGRRELVGLLGTNIPGYTIRRLRIDDTGDVLPDTLVAAGFIDFEKAGTRPVCRDGSIADLIARARMPALLERGREARRAAPR